MEFFFIYIERFFLRNRPGTFLCECESGFTMTSHGCEDVNECILNNGHGPCQDTCVNLKGSYACSCEGLPGTILSNVDKHSCINMNGCVNSNGGNRSLTSNPQLKKLFCNLCVFFFQGALINALTATVLCSASVPLALTWGQTTKPAWTLTSATVLSQPALQTSSASIPRAALSAGACQALSKNLAETRTRMAAANASMWTSA